MNMATLHKTGIHDWHQSHGGKMVDFAGWSMPVQYDSIMAEHVATRQRASLFDVSHMGRFRFDGEGVVPLLDRLVTRRVTNIRPGQVRYGLVTNNAGGILDDVLIYHLVDHDGKPFHAMVVNAGNREKILEWFRPHLSASDVHFTDQTFNTAMIAVQGPHAVAIAERLADTSISALAYYHGCVCHIDGVRTIVSRTGYTGEDGCEITVGSESAVRIWEALMDAGRAEGMVAAGLGARDTLRLEAGMPLYGHELNESINPFQAGLGFAVHLKDREFIGRDALVTLQADAQQPVRIGLRLEGKRVPREHYSVSADGSVIGGITSGTFSPTMECPLAMAYVEPKYSDVGRTVEIDLRGRSHPAKVVPLPFYTRK